MHNAMEHFDLIRKIDNECTNALIVVHDCSKQVGTESDLESLRLDCEKLFTEVQVLRPWHESTQSLSHI